MEMTALPIAGYFQTTRITIPSKGLDFRYGLFWIFPVKPMVAALPLTSLTRASINAPTR